MNRAESFLAGMVLFYVFSAFVSGMPEPDANASRNYRWTYHSLHILAADLSHLIGSRLKVSK